jgi:peptide/nickel transport system permease protein
MAALLIRRLISGVLLIFLLTFLTFVVFNEIPTNPACLVVACGPGTTTTDAQIREADHRLGIDRSVFAQYETFASHLVRHGDLGTAWTTPRAVRAMISQALPITASLVGGGMLLTLLLAIPLGCLGAARPRSSLDRGLLAGSVAGIAIHPFVLGVLILDFSAVHLHIYDFSYCPLTATSSSGCGGPVGWLSHMAVPWLVFALLFLPLYMRMIRTRLLETLSEPWIATARAKGASETRIMLFHALRNATGPVLPMLAIDAGTAITAAIYVETVFGLQGLGSLAVRAFSGQAGGYDLPLSVGIVTVVGTFVVLLNVAADIGGAWLDPRIRTNSTSGLIPLPRAIRNRPCARRTLNGAVGVAAAAAVLLAVTHNDQDGAARVELGQPVAVARPRWSDFTRLQAQVGRRLEHGYLQTTVTQVEIGRSGWRVHAAIANVSPLKLRLAGQAPGIPISYPNQPFSLLIQTDTGSGRKFLKPIPATEFIPALPDVLAARGKWSGTFAGPDALPHHATYLVGFGQFSYDTAAGSQAFAPRPFSTSTSKSAVTR